jgi:dihydroorotase
MTANARGKSASRSVHQRPMPSLLIRGGRVIDPAAKLNATMDVLLREGRVAEVAPPRKLAGADEVFEADGLIVAPGFIDLHVHLREPGQAHKETIASGTAAAAAGGFTAVCTMPNTAPVNDSPEITAWIQHADRGAIVPVFPIAAATVGSAGEQLTDFAALKRAGAIAVSDDGKPILGEAIMREALRLAAQVGLPVVQHAEDTALSSGGVMHEGAIAFRLGLRGISANSEAGIVERDVRLAQQTGAHLHIAHVSTSDSLKAIRHGKRAGVRVTCEVTPHHFLLSDEDVRDYDARYKMNPPLRSADDREELLTALENGTIDAIATDHAPHAAHEKLVEFDRAPFGVIGLETALALAITKLHLARQISLMRIVELLSTNPARIMGFGDRGSLAKGARADVTIFDPKKRWIFQAKESRSKSRNTPFDGAQLTGKVIATVANGEFAFRSS